jgi:hypothetical protein
MPTVIAFLASPLFLRLIMVGVVLEALALVAWHRRTGRGPRPRLVISFLGAGLAFLAALYLVRAHDTPQPAFLLALTAALGFHLWHLALLARR